MVLKLLVDIRQLVIGLYIWLVAAVCEIEGHIEKADDLFAGIDCYFKAI